MHITCTPYLQHFFIHCTGEEPDDADLDAPKIYDPIESYEQLAEKLTMYMAMYNETIRGANMDLVFFKVRYITELVNSLCIWPCIMRP